MRMIRPLQFAAFFAALAAAPAGAAAGEPHGLETRHLAPDLLVRVVAEPTRAALDWAAFDQNPLLEAAPRPPLTGQTREPELGPGLFADLFVPGSQAAAPDPEAAAVPLAWPLLWNWIEREDYQGSEALAEAAASVSRERWGGKRPGQEIAAAYLKLREGAEPELWLTIEFLPGIEAGTAFGDADGDGRREAAGRVKPELLSGKLPALLRDYLTRPLDADEVKVWATELASLWYNKYQTYTLDPVALEDDDDPEMDIAPGIRARIREAAPDGAKPSVLLRGKPAGRWIYNALFVKPSSGSAGAAAGGFKNALRQLLASAPAEERVLEAGGALFLRESAEAALTNPAADGFETRLAFFKGMHDALARRQIRFVLAPVPLKEFALADIIAPGAVGAGAAQAEFRSYVKALEAAGIRVADLTGALKSPDDFLKTDTHWTPAAAARAAGVVFRHLWDNVPTGPVNAAPLARGTVRLAGDLREMLPPERAAGYPPEQAEFYRPAVPAELLDDTSPAAPVMVVSDSFGVVFQRSNPVKAGFVAHLAAQLGRPVELIASQGSPAQAARDLLRKGPAYLDGRKAVVLLFSERFLHPSFEWKPLPWPEAAAPQPAASAPAGGEEAP